MSRRAPDHQAFAVSWGEHLLSGLLHATRGLWRRLGSLESGVCRERIDEVSIDRPIYIAGLARAGSTILLEAVASHPHVATHRYRDFWSIHTPVWADQAGRVLARREAAPVERSHGDGIMVTPDSPEAIEEMLWMQFFSHLHDPAVSGVLDGKAVCPRFQRYYRDHVRKLLLVRGKGRYASKANYNITRLEYLLRMFPDARFILPIRRPRQHIASLQKQHRLLCDAAARHPRSLAYLDRVGHYEFGARRTPINPGDSAATSQVLELWRDGQEVRGWARYWSCLYGFLARQLRDNGALREAAIVVSHDELCDNSAAELSRLFAHCALPQAEQLVERFAARLHRPRYYRPEFSRAEERIIEEETAEVAAQFGLADRDGRCRPRPAEARGTVAASGPG